MSKKMWNKIFKSKTNKNSKALQAANKINKRTSIYEEYQQLNAALDNVPINEKFQDKTKTPSIDLTITAENDNDKDKSTKSATSTTFSKVVNTLTLKRSQNSLKDTRNSTENGEKKSELHIKALSTTSLPAKTNNNSNCNSNNNIIMYSNSNIKSSCSTKTLNHLSKDTITNTNLNTSYNASLNQQQHSLTDIKAKTKTSSEASLKLNNINNNDYLACKPNLTNLIPPSTTSPNRQQKRLSKIVIVVKKFDVPTTTSTSASSLTLAADLLDMNLNKQKQNFCINRTNNSPTNNHFINNLDNGKFLHTHTNTNLETSFKTTTTSVETAINTTTAAYLTSTAINNENQLSINLKTKQEDEETTKTDRYSTFLKTDENYNDHQQQLQPNKVDNGNDITTPTEVPDKNASLELAPCPICSRTFNPVTLRKHVGICEKMAMKKRNKFDSSRQRREGTDLATYCLPKNFGLPEKTTSTTSITQSSRNDRGHSPKPNVQQVSSPILTRKKPSEDLTRSTARASMRKAVANSNNNSLNVSSTPSSNFNRDHRMRSSERSLTRRGIQPPPAEQCPHCERCFGIKAYDRHVEWCKEKALLASIKQGSSKIEGNVAKARLEARTKYRAPCLKTKRSINREKYSGLAGEELDTEDTPKCSKTSLNKTQENNLISMSMTSSLCSERSGTNSTTGNINEPAVAAKENKNKLSKQIAAQKTSKKSYEKLKTAEVQINLSSTKNNLEQNKSGSDLSLKSVHREKCWQPTHKAFENINENQDDRKYHYDNDFSIDAVKFKANQNSKNYSEFMESLQNCGLPKMPEEEMEEYYEEQEARRAASSANEFQNLSLKTNLNLESEKYRDEEYDDDDKGEWNNESWELPRRYSSETDFIENKFSFKHLEDNEDIINPFVCEDFKETKLANKQTKRNCRKSDFKSLKKPVHEDKATTKTDKFVKSQQKPITSKFTQISFESNEFPSEMAIFKDCLTDSDELRRRNSHGKLNSLESKSNQSLNTSKSETFVRDRNQRLQQQLPQPPASCEDKTKNSKYSKTLPQIVPHFDPSTSPPETSRLLPLNLCPTKRKKLLRQTVSCTNTSTSSSFPMKAFSLPLENLEICGVSSAPQIKSYNRSKANKQQEIECNENNCHSIEENDEEKNTCTSLMNKEIKVIKEPPQLKRNRSFTVIGLPDNYDPFLSAKRQLEELCSPSADSAELQNTPLTPKLPSMPATPNNNSKIMSTSLILSSSATAAATTNTTPSLMTTSQITPSPQQTQKTPVLARSSSFRRTSSLRGPRRSPMLSTRPPLFVQKHRPTIQRGLSDEGPISTNFLKPEEYDEMPVRSVCVNDFAINKSPRVIRRDTSASNRKQPLKLNINPTNNSNSNSNTASPNNNNNLEADDSLNSQTASKYVSKTDSLAVFLKFEHDLENLNNSSVNTEEDIAKPSSNLDGPLNAKELKDKSNNLSKQNSNKNIKADNLEAGEENEPTNSKLTFNDTEMGKYSAIRLAPLNTKTSTPLTTRPSTATLGGPVTPLMGKAAPEQQNAFKSDKPVALSSLFGGGGESKTSKQTTHFYTERQNSNVSDYIDPKLINKCDNLPINLNLKRMELKYADSDNTELCGQQFSSSSSESSAATKKSTTSQQQHKLLPLMKQQQLHELSESNSLKASSSNTHHLPLTVTNSQRNSAEGRNLLKRRMRLGRNQFLYDASPEADSCSADDEGANRSSMEGECSQRLKNATKERERAFERLSSAAQVLPIDAPFIPPLPAFDDFDFEEFLSSFENDEEQFPLFKDCREFLMNRTSKKQRSMLMPNSITPNIQTNTLQGSTTFKKSPSPQTFPPLTPQAYASNGQQQQHPQQQQYFQFPTLNSANKTHLNSFNPNTRARSRYVDLPDTKTSEQFCLDHQKEEYRDLASQTLNQKREIFISIETEQNDLDKSPLSPDSIRHMVGNPQTVVEVEVDAINDNKFSKISDDDDAADGLQEPNSRNKNFVQHLPNVQLNNAKNLMQKIQEDFCHLGEDMSVNLKQNKEPRSNPLDVNMNRNSALTAATRSNFVKANRTQGSPSGDAYGDSDDLSSLDGYPLSSPSSRLGISSKTSADSAYGSLSRQRSSELSTQRSSSRSRSMATNTANTLINRPLTEETSLSRLRQLSASSSSSSEHNLPPLNNSSNSMYHKQQQQQNHQQQTHHMFSNNNNLPEVMPYETITNSNNNNHNYDNQPSLAHLTGATNSQSNLESLQQYSSNSTMSTSMKMSKFCHECGNRFLLEQAKFCMDCGVKRIVL